MRLGGRVSSWRALVRHMGPDSSCSAMISLAGSWIVPRRPALSRRALIRIAGVWSVSWPWFVRRGPNSSYGLRCRSSNGSIPRGPGSFCRALMLPVGPWNLIENRSQLGAQGGPGGPASVFGTEKCWLLVIVLGGGGAWPECPPGTATANQHFTLPLTQGRRHEVLLGGRIAPKPTYP